MSDLFNEFPSWGETGEYPADGFFYSGGDQVNEKHLDALWNGIDKHVQNINEAIEERVRDLDGDVVLDGGLVASTGTNTREVDVSSSVGAYVDGHKTENVGGVTLTLSANSGTSTRTDVIYLQEDGSIAVDKGTSLAPAETLTIAEADVATDDTISAIRNYARDRTFSVASERSPSGSAGDVWHDLSSDERKAYVAGSYGTVAVDGHTGSSFDFSGDISVSGSINTDGSAVTLRDTTNNTDLLVANEGGPINTGVNLQENGNRVATRTWANSNLVEESGDAMSGSLDMGHNSIKQIEKAQYSESDWNSGDYIGPSTLGSSSNDNVRLKWEFYDSSAGSYEQLLTLNASGPIEVKNRGFEVESGQISEQGNRVATRTWVGNNHGLEDARSAGSQFNGEIGMAGNDIVSVRDVYSQNNGRILLRTKGSSGELGFYSDYDSKWVIRSYNGGKLEATANNGFIDLSLNDRMNLPERGSDPSANPGQIWYRSDLD